MRESYRWDEHSYAALTAAGVDWRAAISVLYDSRPRVRWHLGAVLRIAAPAPDGLWLAVTCIEESDDEYLVVTARYLDDDERDAVQKMIEGGS